MASRRCGSLLGLRWRMSRRTARSLAERLASPSPIGRGDTGEGFALAVFTNRKNDAASARHLSRSKVSAGVKRARAARVGNAPSAARPWLSGPASISGWTLCGRLRHPSGETCRRDRRLDSSPRSGSRTGPAPRVGDQGIRVGRYARHRRRSIESGSSDGASLRLSRTLTRGTSPHPRLLPQRGRGVPVRLSPRSRTEGSAFPPPVGRGDRGEGFALAASTSRRSIEPGSSDGARVRLPRPLTRGLSPHPRPLPQRGRGGACFADGVRP